MKHPVHTLKCRSGFTLAELLAVIVIIGILAAASVPAFLSFGGESKVGSAATQLSATLRLARQYAISNNQYTSVVFPHSTDSVDTANTNSASVMYSDYESKQRMLRGYAVYTPRDGYVTDWKFLPEGVIFNCETNTSTNVLYDEDAMSDVAYPNNGSSVLGMQAVTYRADGSTAFGTIPFRVYFSSGFTNADTDPSPSAMDYTLTRPSGTYIEIAPLTGIVKVVSDD